jgi:drug/metabolite transporter (DMT)-like permease
MGTERPKASRVALLAGFAVLYFVWGSTYLAIKIAVESSPPFLMAGTRFLISVVLLASWSWFRGDPWPTLRQWRNASVAGILLFVGGNGGVSYSQLFIPSGLAALVVATVPAWLALFDWLAVSGRQPRALELAGIGLGLGGVSMLTMVGH